MSTKPRQALTFGPLRLELQRAFYTESWTGHTCCNPPVAPLSERLCEVSVPSPCLPWPHCPARISPGHTDLWGSVPCLVKLPILEVSPQSAPLEEDSAHPQREPGPPWHSVLHASLTGCYPGRSL